MLIISALVGTLGLVAVQLSASAASAIAGILERYSLSVIFPICEMDSGIFISLSINCTQFTNARTVVMVLKFCKPNSRVHRLPSPSAQPCGQADRPFQSRRCLKFHTSPLRKLLPFPPFSLYCTKIEKALINLANCCIILSWNKKRKFLTFT